jgi:ABC-type polysaccharide/polyol phosphate transport system ATPase subunit
VVSGILRPTQGRVSVEGRTAALLELGAGFNPEFSGRENVFLNSEILGLSRKQTEQVFPAIQKFAEIGEFIDRPVKEYSSGMYVRLAFATAIHVEPDVLIVDEALAVGDAIFSIRCLQKLEEMKNRGVTILFVSHDLGIVKRLCHRAILMLNGSIHAEGTPNDVVNKYVALVHSHQNAAAPAGTLSGNSRHGDATSRIQSVELLDAGGRQTTSLRSGDLATFRITAIFHRNATNPIVGMLIRNRLGIDVFGTNTRIENISIGNIEAGESLELEFRFPCALTRQEYTLTAAIQNSDGSSQDWWDDALQFTVIEEKEYAGLANLQAEVAWQVGRGVHGR